MESTGKYWIPVFNILERSCFVTLAHPKYTKPQKGNKTDRTGALCLYRCRKEGDFPLFFLSGKKGECYGKYD